MDNTTGVNLNVAFWALAILVVVSQGYLRLAFCAFLVVTLVAILARAVDKLFGAAVDEPDEHEEITHL